MTQQPPSTSTSGSANHHTVETAHDDMIVSLGLGRARGCTVGSGLADIDLNLCFSHSGHNLMSTMYDPVLAGQWCYLESSTRRHTTLTGSHAKPMTI